MNLIWNSPHPKSSTYYYSMHPLAYISLLISNLSSFRQWKCEQGTRNLIRYLYKFCPASKILVRYWWLSVSCVSTYLFIIHAINYNLRQDHPSFSYHIHQHWENELGWDCHCLVQAIDQRWTTLGCARMRKTVHSKRHKWRFYTSMSLFLETQQQISICLYKWWEFAKVQNFDQLSLDRQPVVECCRLNLNWN